MPIKLTYEEAVTLANELHSETARRNATANGRSDPNADDQNAGQAASDSLLALLGYGDQIA